MRRLLDFILKQLVLVGRLTVRFPDGRLETYGPGPEPVAGVSITSWSTVRGLLSNPALVFGEAYVEQTLMPLDCDLQHILDLLFVNLAAGGKHQGLTIRRAIARALRVIAQYNPVPRAQRNIEHHYDLSGRLYALFLDRDRQYSCAYFRRGDETLEEAQAAKKQHIAAKLCLDRPDLEVLDIGSGWGGMALTLAQDYGARVTGITLSTEQLFEARARAEAAGLSHRVRFELLDYRNVLGRYDRIVCVGMFEHVGITHYREFFRAVRRLLTSDGVALIHAIGRSDGPSVTNPWLARHIFPGGYSPALSEVFAAVERSGLIAADCEILRLHYAETLRHWRRRFAANRDTIAALYDERFCRMFELYLTGSEMTFRRLGHIVWQMQLAASHKAVPLSRDYMVANEMAGLGKIAGPDLAGSSRAGGRAVPPTLSRNPGR
jgi:cyclopropane-fatty-acyl-phospholipid synthase